MKAKRKRKPGGGRKPSAIPTHPVRLSLDAGTVHRGKAIGFGNLSAGVRTAVAACPVPMYCNAINCNLLNGHTGPCSGIPQDTAD